MRTFITGIDGFIGSHLAKALHKAGDDISGLVQKNDNQLAGIHLDEGNILDLPVLARVIKKASPDRIFHLAAQSNIPYSFQHPQETISVNVTGTVNLLEAIAQHAPRARVISVGSSAEYGFAAPLRGRITEENRLYPLSPYAISKASQSMLALLYSQWRNLHICHIRPFAVIGPGKTGDALSDFCRAVVRLEQIKSAKPFLPVGNLAATRDFIDVRDCVRAMIIVSLKGRRGGIYNICNGQPINLNRLVMILRKMSARKFTIRVKKSTLRAVDDPYLVGNNTKLRQLGYRRSFYLSSTIKDTLNFWRKRRYNGQDIAALYQLID